VIRAGDDLAAMVSEAVASAGLAMEPWDVVVVTHKAVSKAEGRLIAVADVVPSAQAAELAALTERDPRLCEVILGESRRVVWADSRVLITETRQGHVVANAGVDLSNVDGGASVVLLPLDADASAAQLRRAWQLRMRGGDEPLGVVISDTWGRPFRMATTNVALGVAGLPALSDHRGLLDTAGYELAGSVLASADEIAGAAELVMGKTEAIPVALVRGLRWEGEGRGADLVRPEDEDVFRPR
jgi:coenzyme F420-0:L-glutamate ligase/coenzyme F420-1:gamma-L-glutamate ligase